MSVAPANAVDGAAAPDAEWVILCEGYHDRSFWAGMLEKHLKLPKALTDARGRSIVKGQFGYRTQAGTVVRIVPCGSKSLLDDEIAARLQRRTTDLLRGLVIVTDEDQATSASDARERAVKRLGSVAAKHGGGTSEGTNQVTLADSTRLFAVTWACDDDASDALPPAQCLERLVVASLVAAFPDRGVIVQNWLRDPARKGFPADTYSINKAYAWSHMAGWYAGYGCDSFLQLLWAESLVAPQLERRLNETGSWAVIERLVTER